jgi:hypothetical protein
MSRRELEDLLERIEDTREIVLGPMAAGWAPGSGELYAVWNDARHVANRAYLAWRENPGREAYAAYRAAADRADAAADALAVAGR